MSRDRHNTPLSSGKEIIAHACAEAAAMTSSGTWANGRLGRGESPAASRTVVAYLREEIC